MPKTSFDDVYAFSRTTFGLLLPSDVTLPKTVVRKEIKSGLWERHCWFTVEPYFWFTPPQNWNLDIDLVFRFQETETGRLRIRLSNEFVASTDPVGFLYSGSSDQPVMTFQPKQTATAGYSNVTLPCHKVAVEADAAELVIQRKNITFPYDLNAVLAGFRILSQRPV